MFESLDEDPDPNRNVVIVTHGMVIKMLLMTYFKLTVEEFHNLRNVDNCEFIMF